MDALERLLKLPLHATKRAFEILNENKPLNSTSDINIGKKVLVVGKSERVEEFFAEIKDGFEVYRAENLLDLSGSIGNFRAKISESSEIKVAQIVLFSAPAFIDRSKTRLGLLFVSDYRDKNELISELDSNIGEFFYENTILYESQKCQFFRREKSAPICHKCADICPTYAITKDLEKRELIFSDIDCISCGKCVGICPSGAMQKSHARLEFIAKATREFSKIPLLIGAEDVELVLEFFENNQNAPFEPFILPNVNMLNEVYLLTILQESGCGAIIFGDFNEEIIDFINAIYQRIYGKPRVLGIKNDLARIFETSENLARDSELIYRYEARGEEFSREIFANRLLFMVKNGDFGEIKNHEYGDISIDNSCTLCASCVEACNTNALICAKDGFELLLKPAICTMCGYCEAVCPENALKIDRSGIKLKNEYFSHQSKIKDSPFYCVECGKIIASEKSILKVEKIMLPLLNDAKKVRALRCCSDCKVRVMFLEATC